MLQFKSKAIMWRPDFIVPLLVRALAGRDEANLRKNLKKQKAKARVVIVFAQNADIKFLIGKEYLARRFNAQTVKII